MHELGISMQEATRRRIFLWFAQIWNHKKLSRRQLWIGVCCLQCLLGIIVVQATQDNATVTLLALIIWWGASLSVEELIGHLRGKPQPVPALMGLLILLFCCWRAYATYHLDTIVYALFAIQGLGLALIGWPTKYYWRLFVQPIFILSLFYWQLLVQRAIPMNPVTKTTAKAVELLLSLFDYQVLAQGNTIYHQTGRIIVVNGCSGLELAIQLTVTAIIFVLVFPLKNRINRILAILVAPIIALLVNTIRVAILTCIHASNIPGRQTAFDLIHEHWGGLLFAGLAVALFGLLYLHWVDQQVILSKLDH